MKFDSIYVFITKEGGVMSHTCHGLQICAYYCGIFSYLL